MRQETPSRRKALPKFFPLAVGALVAAALLGACDRPAVQQAETPVPPRLTRETAQGAQLSVSEAPRTVPLQLSSRETLTDTVITGRINAAIRTDPGMAGSDVSVITDRGVVALAGQVKTPDQTAIASAHAQRQDGVMRVDNHLSVPRT